jgi:hypothetical protein
MSAPVVEHVVKTLVPFSFDVIHGIDPYDLEGRQARAATISRALSQLHSRRRLGGIALSDRHSTGRSAGNLARRLCINRHVYLPASRRRCVPADGESSTRICLRSVSAPYATVHPGENDIIARIEERPSDAATDRRRRTRQAGALFPSQRHTLTAYVQARRLN